MVAVATLIRQSLHCIFTCDCDVAVMLCVLLAGLAGLACLAGGDLLVSLPSLGVWHKRQLFWPRVQVSACIPHAWRGWGWGLAVDRAGAPPSDLGTACVDHLGSARGRNVRVNLLRKLCFRGLKMVSAGPLFIGGAGHARKNRGGCAGLTVSELGLSLLSFSGWTVASKSSRAGRWDANKRRGGEQGF